MEPGLSKYNLKSTELLKKSDALVGRVLTCHINIGNRECNKFVVYAFLFLDSPKMPSKLKISPFLVGICMKSTLRMSNFKVLFLDHKLVTKNAITFVLW
jgi:hypothetical protein